MSDLNTSMVMQIGLLLFNAYRGLPPSIPFSMKASTTDEVSRRFKDSNQQVTSSWPQDWTLDADAILCVEVLLNIIRSYEAPAVPFRQLAMFMAKKAEAEASLK